MEIATATMVDQVVAIIGLDHLEPAILAEIMAAEAVVIALVWTGLIVKLLRPVPRKLSY